MVRYIAVAESENSEIIDLPLENDGSIFVSTLAAQFPNASGLKYKVNGRVRAVKCVDNRLYEPEEGWGDEVFYCVFAKAGEKRKHGEEDGESKKFKNTVDSPAFSSDLVVLGLPWKTTDEELRDYFEQFGSLELAKVKTDRVSGRSKGYGFIRFNDPEVQVKVMLKRHKFDDRYCDIRIPNSNKPYSGKDAVKKIFIGQLVEDAVEDDLRDYFGKYGEITDAFIPRPFRGFGFVTFAEPDVVSNITNREHAIKGTKVFVTEAIPKYETMKFNAAKRGERGPGGRFGGGFDSYGGDRGGYSSSFGGSRGGNASEKWGSARREWMEDRWGDSYNSSPVWKSAAPKPDLVDPMFQTAVNKAVHEVLSTIKGGGGGDRNDGYSENGHGQGYRTEKSWNKWS